MDNPSTPKRDYTLQDAAGILRMDEAEVSGMIRRGQLTGYMDEDGILHVLLPVPDGGRPRRPGGGNGHARGPAGGGPSGGSGAHHHAAADPSAATAGATASITPPDPLTDGKVWECLRDTFQMQRDLIGQLVQTFPTAPPPDHAATAPRAEPGAEASAGVPDPNLDARLSRLEQTVERQQEDLRLLTESVRIVRDYLDKK